MNPCAPRSVTFAYSATYPTQVSPRLTLSTVALSRSGGVFGQAPLDYILDTGAEETFLDASMARLLNVNQSDLKPGTYSGVDGQRRPCLRGTARLGVCGGWLYIPVRYVKGLGKNLLGRGGVLDEVTLGLDHKNGTILASIE